MYYVSIFILNIEILIRYRNKKWVTNSKGAPPILHKSAEENVLKNEKKNENWYKTKKAPLTGQH